MLKYVYGTKERIFVNTTIGCRAACKYCYLPSIRSNLKLSRTSCKEVIRTIEGMNEFIPGEGNTVLSIGCYSECMFPDNIQDTLEIITYFIKKRNYIQLSTKQIIPEAFCKTLSEESVFNNQINIYISMPTYSRIDKIEPGTAELKERIENISRCKKYGLNVILYIKPFLERITSEDINYYIDLVKRYNIPVVIGSYLGVEKTKHVADVGEYLLFEKETSEEMKNFVQELSKYTKVYSHSTDVIKELRREKNGDARNCC